MTIKTSLRKEDIESLFFTLTEIEIKASIDSVKAYPKTEAAAQSYIMGIEECRHILKLIMEDVE
jgi:hypothetical protein